jgi:Tol biopolymer transport system component
MLIAAIASLDPYPMSKNQPDSPPMLDHVAQRCLAKDPDDRWQTAHDLLLQLRWVAEGGDVLLAAARDRQKRERRLLAGIAAAVFVLTVGVTEAARYFGRTDNSEAFQYRIPVAGLNSADISVSPDGKLSALVAKPNTQDSQALYVRPTGSTEFRRLVGTEDASQPFWSPDSRYIGFFAGGRVKRVDSKGGAPKDLGPAPGFTGGAWGSSGVILFGSSKGLFRVSQEGGQAEPATVLGKEETGHYWPSFLPDGQRFIYLAWSADAAKRTIFIGRLGTTDKTELMTADSNGIYAEPGYVLFHRDATLFAQPVDPKRLTRTGDPLHIADQVEINTSNGRGSFDVSQNGTVLYFQGQGGRGGQSRAGFTTNYLWGWYDKTGTALQAAGDVGTFGDMDLSHDGKLLAVTEPDASAGGADIWVIDWQNAGRPHRITLDPGDDINPVWERPSGNRIAFTTYRKGNADIYIKNANGLGDETPILDSPENESIEGWSADGRYIVYKFGPSDDLWILPMFGDKKPFPIVKGPFHKDEAQFSYDGKWLAYTSDEGGGLYQTFVVSLPPGPEQRVQVSKEGGGQPRWKGDGTKLFFRAFIDGSVMEAVMTYVPTLSAGIPMRLFGSPALNSPSSKELTRHQWGVTSDGQRFLGRIPPNQGATGFVAFAAPTSGPTAGSVSAQQAQVASGLTIIRNWMAASRKETP